MEPVGLAVGLAGLVGTFTACLDIVDRIDSYKDYGVDSRAVLSQFDADRLLFRRWGNAVGLDTDDGTLRDGYHTRLDDPKIRSAVQKILNSIKEIAGEPNAQAGPIGSKDHKRISGALFEHYRETNSRRSKLGWTIHKARFHALAQHFRGLVDRLRELVPPEKPTYSGRIQATDGSELDHSSYFLDLQKVLAEVERQIEHETRKDLEAWLQASHTDNFYDDAVQKRLPGTCDWILERKVFQKWQSSDYQPETAKILWINGPPGYGKTILSTNILQKFAEESHSPVVSFLFSSDLEDRADPFTVIRSWLSQLVSRRQDAFELACEKQGSQIGKTASNQDLLELFNVTMRMIPNCTCVVDGLDECTSKTGGSSMDSKSLAYFIRTTTQALAGTHSRMLVVSREDRDIREGFYGHNAKQEGLELNEYKITTADVQPDATLFSQHIVDQKLNNKSQEMRDGISQRIVSRCDSMFLRIKLLENDLRGGKSQKALERIVDQIPMELAQLYDRNWQRIMEHENDRNRALAILRWVTVALRPMTILEITEALLLEEDDSANNMEDELPDSIDEDYVKTEIVDLCASLLETRGTDRTAGLGAKTLHLTHFTVRQYILGHLPISGTQLIAEDRAAHRMQGIGALSLPHTDSTTTEYILSYVPVTGTQLVATEKLQSTNESTHSNIVAEMCLRYLCLPQAWDNPQEGTDEIKWQRSFRKYAADYWHAHFKDGYPNSEAVMNLITTLFRPNNKSWEAWRQHHDADKANNKWYNEEVGDTKPNNRLFYAASLGLQRIVERMIENDTHVDYVDGSNRTALLAAAETGRLTLLQYLLGKGANPNTGTSIGRTPLHAAVVTRDIEMARLLLDHGASWNKGGSTLHTPLSSASARGHFDIVRLFLDRGADPALEDDEGWTPLLTASTKGRLEVVRLLLDWGADPTFADDEGWTPLLTASTNGHLEVVRLLLDRGADLAATISDGWTALLHASDNGHLEVVRLLLDRGADCSQAATTGWTSLNLASDSGHLEVVRLLLDQDANLIDTPCEGGWSPLINASSSGHVEIVRLLLKAGADYTATTESGRTALNFASRDGWLEVVRLLLDQDTDLVGIPDENGWHPLHLAAMNGHIEIISAVLEKGAEIDSPDNWGQTPLAFASSGGHTEAIRLLLDKGAEIESRDNWGGTPLSVASTRGHTETIRLLLDKGAEIESRDNWGGTPLSVASTRGHTKTVRLLLNRGAETQISDRDGDTPLSVASIGNHTETVRLLLDHGAVGIPNHNGAMPLEQALAKGHVEIVQMFIENGADWVIPSRASGMTTMHLAAFMNDTKTIQLLISKDSQAWDKRDAFGRLPIYWSILWKRKEAFEVLVRKHHDLNVTDRYGFSPTSAAARCGDLEMLERLLSISQDNFNAADNFGRTSIWWAERQDHEDVICRLKKQAASLGVVPLTPNLEYRQPVQFDNSRRSWCEVCSSGLTDQDEFYSCSLCLLLGFAVCMACKELGAHCFDESHTLQREGIRG